MSDMVERVAAKMIERRRELIAQPLSRIWEELARVAIEAMMEPTEEMITSGLDNTVGPTDVAYVFTAMIQEALKESA